MPKKKANPPKVASSETRRKASTPEARENQLIALAMDVAEQQMLDGTASPQLISHFLKMGSTKNRYEIAKLKRENKLLEAKTEAIESSKRTEELYRNALEAMQRYGGSMFGANEDE